MRDKYTLLLVLALFFIISSCDIFNPEEQIPAYIHIDKIDFKAGSQQGTDSAQILDAWVYVNNDLIGAFELPATIPILAEGKQSLSIYPGIKLNGIAATRASNPFWEHFEFDVDFEAEQTIHLNKEFNLTSTYIPETTFAWNESIGEENFEDSGISFDSIVPSDVKVRKTKDEVYEGTFSGWIHLDAQHPQFLAASQIEFPVITGNRPVFLEIHVKNEDHAMEVGFFETYSASSVVKSEYMLINSGPEWKKMYINLTPHMSVMASASTYKIYFQTYLRSDKTEANIYIDNIKLIYL